MFNKSHRKKSTSLKFYSLPLETLLRKNLFACALPEILSKLQNIYFMEQLYVTGKNWNEKKNTLLLTR